MTSTAAIAQPCINHHHLSFNHGYSLSSSAITTTTFSSPRLHVYKAYNSIQINNNPNYHQGQQHSRNSTNSTTFPSIPRNSTGASDSELRAVLELATNSELLEIEKILFGPSYLSPLLKSLSNGIELDRFMIEEDFEQREHFIEVLESRFLYLAADARSTLRGWRPSYRNVLLDVRKELKIPCSKKLSTDDLEVEIFIHILGECSRDWDTAAALKVGSAELCSVLLKGGQLISMLKLSELVTTRLSGKMLFEAAKHKLDSKVVKKGLTGAASKYLGFHSLAAFIGPMVWGTFLADVVIQMLGTDYIRILQAIYALAQIRILRRHGLYLDKLKAGF
ncbi:uncharacterized protein LOC110692420 isoform X2 [Chenopodium quinoa]|uniref:uncharacterized protein LOC110692420 isoform X2 n=1 Tax=Chenopodium quinoa TaxID=63459 RepID=UPI000B780467|nr:uncharacterized protein LOC110692420 isoform X2 [Chenopodium quinoa]